MEKSEEFFAVLARANDGRWSIKSNGRVDHPLLYCAVLAVSAVHADRTDLVKHSLSEEDGKFMRDTYGLHLLKALMAANDGRGSPHYRLRILKVLGLTEQ